MLVLRFRPPTIPAALYLLVALLALAAVAVVPGKAPDPAGEPSVPAWTGGDAQSVERGPEPAGGRLPVILAFARWLAAEVRASLPATDGLKAALRAALPGLAQLRAPDLPLAEGAQPGRQLLDTLVSWAGGAELGRPWTLLAAELPAMRLVEVPERQAPLYTSLSSLLPPSDPDAWSGWTGSGTGQEAGPGQPGAGTELLEPPPPAFEQPAGEPVVFIYHTHTSERYLGPVPARTAAQADTLAFGDDPDETIVRVGAVMARRFEEKGLGVVHLTTVFDRNPGGAVNRVAAYVRSRKVLFDFDGKGPLLKAFPSLRLVLDVHRDHLSDDVGRSREVTTVEIGGEKVARVLIVVGGRHAGAHTNYCFALNVARLMDRRHPGLSRGVRLREDDRYNQDVAPGALLFEIGGTFNTLAEAERAARLVADVLVEALQQGLVPEPGRPYDCVVSPSGR